MKRISHTCIQLLTSIALFNACSASDGPLTEPTTNEELAEGSPEAPVENPDEHDAELGIQSLEEMEAEFQRKASASLSTEEGVIVNAALEAQGIPAESVRFVGRLVLVDDAYLYADDLLATNPGIEKGKVLSAVDNSPSSTGSGAIAPNIYARTSGGQFQFYHPYLGFNGQANKTVHFIVPDSPSWLLTAFDMATTEIENASNDCLDTPRFTAIRRSDWNALGPAQAGIPNVSVAHGSAACPGNLTLAGCAHFPRIGSIVVPGPGGASQTRMLIGGRIGLNSSFVKNTQPASLSIVIHEILHTLGVAHPFAEPISKLVVAGTSSLSGVVSIMHPINQDGAGSAVSPFSFTLTTDDIDVIDTLYDPQAGTCNFPAGFQTVLGD